jgi:hypothetical protein
MAFEEVRPIFGLEDLPRGKPVDPVSVERIMKEHPGLLTRFITMLGSVHKDPTHSTPYAVAMRLSQSFVRGAYEHDPAWTKLDLVPVAWSRKMSEEEHAERHRIFRLSEKFVAAHILPIANLYTVWTAFHHPELVAIPRSPISILEFQTNGHEGAKTELQAETVERERADRRQIRLVAPAIGRIVGRMLIRRPRRRPDSQVVPEDPRREKRRLEDDRPDKSGPPAKTPVETATNPAVRSRRRSTKWTFAGACALLILNAAHPIWIAVSPHRSHTSQAPQVPKRSDADTEGVRPAQTATPQLPPSLGSPETFAETPSEKASSQPGKSRKKAAPLASSEEQRSSRQAARPSVRNTTGPEPELSDPKDPAGVIDWVLKERSATP